MDVSNVPPGQHLHRLAQGPLCGIRSVFYPISAAWTGPELPRWALYNIDVGKGSLDSIIAELLTSGSFWW